MKFSIFLMGTRNGTYSDIVEQVAMADRLDFDAVWLAERYFANSDLLFPSPTAVAAYFAARTKRIRIGFAARVLPFHHPLHVAADACTLDILSNGRFDLGLSRGSMDETPHRAFGVSRQEAREQFEESLAVLRLAFGQKPFSFHGKYYQLDDITPGPPPVQSPHPPLYMVANSPVSLQAAADNGLPVFINGAQLIEDMKESLHCYRMRSFEAGYNPDDVDLPINRFIFVGETTASARSIMREPFMEFLDRRAPDLKRLLLQRHAQTGLDFEFLAEEVCIFGDADHCVARLRDLMDRVGLRHILCSFNMITLDHRQCVESMRRFAMEVIPALREELPPPTLRPAHLQRHQTLQ